MPTGMAARLVRMEPEPAERTSAVGLTRSLPAVPKPSSDILDRCIASIDMPDRRIRCFETLEAARIDGPSGERLDALRNFVFRRITWPPERQDAASGAEIVLSGK